MSDLVFSSVNPYQSLQAIVADDPQGLVKALTDIKTPVKVIAIVAYGTKQVAYVMGDIRNLKLKSIKGKNNGNSNSSGA